MFKYFILLTFLSCAFVHKHQVQDINHKILKGKKFEFMLSEVGVEVAEGVRILGALSNNRNTNSSAQSVAGVIELFQMGPRTGRPIYNLNFTNKLTEKIITACGKQEVSGLTFLREMNKYPVVSGELIKVSGYCI